MSKYIYRYEFAKGGSSRERELEKKKEGVGVEKWTDQVEKWKEERGTRVKSENRKRKKESGKD